MPLCFSEICFWLNICLRARKSQALCRLISCQNETELVVITKVEKRRLDKRSSNPWLYLVSSWLLCTCSCCLVLAREVVVLFMKYVKQKGDETQLTQLRRARKMDYLRGAPLRRRMGLRPQQKGPPKCRAQRARLSTWPPPPWMSPQFNGHHNTSNVMLWNGIAIKSTELKHINWLGPSLSSWGCRRPQSTKRKAFMMSSFAIRVVLGCGCWH